ncbi:hypothetical protein Ocin01_12816 [Orchesella cincta]|uniref:C2H2-type domain-containing protein n=1 Tax=Orchesella cincta TaxID=48709 RepID=A0A1D2MLE8_ORCCI|nr:hypothetical protein Ocin01_12816 [Orchesella cincta]
MNRRSGGFNNNNNNNNRGAGGWRQGQGQTNQHQGDGMMGGNMGMVQSQNPFAAAVMNQQKPMQVIVGNLPGLNPAAFGQQVLPAYGQGVGEQNMGMFGQQTQHGSSNRYGRDFNNSSDRGRSQRNPNQKVSLVRRNEANDRGRVAASRGVAKKRYKYITAKGEEKDGVKTDEAKDKPAENGEVNAEDKKDGAEGEAADGEPKPSKYDEFPVELLVCKICKKSMSDGPSFESHLTGKAHLTLLKILEEKFTKRAELLMNESKMCEDEIAVEKDRQRRAGKGGHGGKGNKNHCKMCDCNYTVNWGTHKQSVWHRVLKEFLHPNCRFCKSQFVHRRDWIEHLFSTGHLKKLLQLKEEGQIVTDQETTSQEELFAVHIEINKDERPLNIVNIHTLGGRVPLTDDVKDMLQGEKGELVLPEGEIPIPDKFDESVAVGEDAIVVVGGSCCKVCRIYINAGEEGAHCKGRQHFDSYVEYLRRVVKLREQKVADEKKAQEEVERKAKAEAEAAAKALEAEAAAKVAAEAAKAAGSEEKMDTGKEETKEVAKEAEETKPAGTGSQQQQTPVRTPQTRVDANMRGARGGPARGGRGGARGSPRGGRWSRSMVKCAAQDVT